MDRLIREEAEQDSGSESLMAGDEAADRGSLAVEATLIGEEERKTSPSMSDEHCKESSSHDASDSAEQKTSSAEQDPPKQKNDFIQKKSLLTSTGCGPAVGPTNGATKKAAQVDHQSHIKKFT